MMRPEHEYRRVLSSRTEWRHKTFYYKSRLENAAAVCRYLRGEVERLEEENQRLVEPLTAKDITSQW